MQINHPSIPSLKEKQRQEREELIIQAAEEVLMEKGYYETSMDEIAARVGIAKGTIYKHFPGKEELVLDIFKRDLQELMQGIDDIIDKESTASAKLKALFSFLHTGFFGKRTQLISSMYNGVDLKRLLVEQGSCIKDLWQSAIERVKQLLEEGKAAGEFDPSLPTSIMVFSFFSVFSPKVYDHLILEENIAHEEIINYLWHIYVNGIGNSQTK